MRRLKKLLKNKREKLEELLNQIAPVYIQAPDCDDEIAIIFGLDEKFMKELKSLLASGVEVKEEDISNAKADFKAYVQDLLDQPDEDFPKDLIDDPERLEKWIMKNHPRALQIQEIIKLLESYCKKH